MKTIKALIIDDEVRSRTILKRMLSTHCQEVAIVGDTDNINEAIVLINKTEPDLLFLDVQLKNETGFDLLGQISGVDFQTILITAHDTYAIKAIKWSVTDYLLKPIDPEELIASVRKAINNKNKSVNQKTSETEEGSIGLPTINGIKFFPSSDIIRCEAKGTYTEFFFTNNKKLLVSKPIKVYEELLSTHGYFRVHKSHLINLKHVKEYIKGRGGNLIMTDNSTVIVASQKKDEFLKCFLH